MGNRKKSQPDSGKYIRKQRRKRHKESEERFRAVWETAVDAMILTDQHGIVIDANPSYYCLYGYKADEIVGKDFTIIFPEELRQSAQERYAVLFRGPLITQPLETIIIRADGTSRIVEAHYSFLSSKGTRTAMLSIIRDITERKRAIEREQVEEQLERQVTQRTQELTSLLQVSQALASKLELQPLLSTIFAQLKKIVDYDEAALLAMQNGRLIPLRYEGQQSSDQMEKLVQIFEQSPLFTRILQRREPVIVEDFHQDARFLASYRSVMSRQAEQGLGFVRSWIGVPLVTDERTIGILTTNHHISRFYVRQHVHLAFALANQVAVALENTYLYEQAKEVAALQERQRLARELHDTVSQVLYGISLTTRSALENLEQVEREETREALDRIVQYTAGGLAEMRALLIELRPEVLEHEGLVSVLEKQVTALRAAYRLHVDAELSKEPDVSIEIKQALYRVGQEALHNVVKHARAKHVQVRLRQEEHTVELEVRDDGKGFDPAGPFPGHFGLQSMRERLQFFKGTVTIDSAPGKGTRVLVQIP